ncbi:MAG: TonB-dependent receptor [Flavobacteriaceae bacterium]|jgi:outer membrane receptor protein involved in Fe transport|nr:TonB-dependent receptor [Flavobacteriaceae bacterium]
MTTKFWSIILFLLSVNITAQSIQGKIIHAETGKPVANAEVQLFKSSDALAQKTTTDSLGIFSFSQNTSPNFYLLIAADGFDQMKIENFTNNQNILFRPVASTISEVTVQGKRSVQLNNGNPEYSVSGNKDLKTAVNLIDVLRKTPGVSLGEDNAVMIGRNVASIFVDGKPLVMSAQELQDYLKTLTPDMVNAVEIIANPSSKFDAEIKGIVNIKLKKNNQLGLRGNYSGNLQINKTVFVENNLNISYNTNRVAYKLVLGYNNGINTYKYNALQHLANTNIMRTNIYQRMFWRVYNFQAGLDFRINDYNKIGLTFRQNNRDDQRNRVGELLTRKKNDVDIVSVTGSENPINYHQNNTGVMLDYSFSKNNFEFNVIGNYLSVKNNQNDDFIDRDKLSEVKLSHWKSDLLNKVDILTLQTDLSKKIGGASLEAGLKFSSSETHNNIRYDTLSSNQKFEYDPRRSNVFLYKEKIYAGYISYSQKFGKFSINGGLRAEHTNSISNAITMDSVVNRSYTKWLPSLNIGYTINNSTELSLSYSRRMTRPPFSQLNPFRVYFSPLNYWIGNPYLLPSVTSQLKATFRKKNFITSLIVGRENDVIVRYPIYYPDTNVLEYLGTNLPYQDFAILEISFPIKLTKWWNVNTQWTGNYNYEYRPYLDTVFTKSLYSYTLRINQTFTLPKGYTANIFSHFESQSGNSLYIYKSRYTVDLSIQKNWFDNKLNTKLSFNNVFDSFDQTLLFRHKQIMNNQLRHWNDLQKVVFALSYNFGSSKYESKELKRSEEESRTR